MDPFWSRALTAADGIPLLWLELIGIVAWFTRRQGESITLVEALRLASDRLRLVRRLAVAPGGFAL